MKKPEVFPADFHEWAIRARRDDANLNALLAHALTPSSNCVDVGAHRGLVLQRFMASAPEGRHLAFEPLPELAAILKSQFPGVRVYDCALGDRHGRARFVHVPEMPDWSGLMMQPYPGEAHPEEIEVDVRRLDDLIGSDDRIDFIKIDVEGGELDVLRGAEVTIRRWQPCIVYEHAAVHTKEYGTPPGALYDFIVDRCGLRVYSLDRSGPLSRERYLHIYCSSFESNYDRTAETNFLAMA